MELTLERQTLYMKEEIRNEMQEHAIDSELILPDVCGDIGRILKCKGQPKIFRKQIAGNTLTLEGSVSILLLYVSEEGRICSYHQNLPLYHEMAVSEETAFAQVTAKMDYCNCRVVNTRKVEIHGAVSLRVVTVKKAEIPLVLDAKGNGVELLREEKELTTLLAVGEKTLTLTDEFQVTTSDVRCILRSSGAVMDEDCKTLAGKAVVKGTLQVCALYETHDGGHETLRGQIPFTQMLDMDGMEEDAFCNVRFTVNSLELRPKTGLDGECKNIMVSADITVTAEGMKTLSLPIVTDGYSTCAGLGLRRYGGTLKRLISLKNQCHSLKKTVELGREISKVIDMWCDVTDCHVRTEGDGTILSGMLTLCVLANDSDGVPLYLEKAIDYNVEQRESSQGGTLMCEGEVTVEKFSFTLTGDATVEIRGELKANTMVYEMLSVSAVTELTVDDSVTPPASVAPLAIYYATAGERLFDIARRYNTTCKAIVDANGGVETVVNTPKALLIPVS